MKRIPEREAARAAGERFYTTGKPCRNGHVAKRYTASGICATCAVNNALKFMAKTPEHPNRVAARAAGDLHYSTGKPCKHGHDKRFVSNGQCTQCSLAKCKRWNGRNPGYEAAGARRRRAADPTGHRAEVSKYAKNNREKRRQADKAWRDANREYWRSYQAVYSQNRRARKAKNGGFYTIDDVHVMRKRQHGKCAACNRDDLKLEVDHIVPVVKGGSNDPSNLQLLCGPCNKSKGHKDFESWLLSRRSGNPVLSCN